MSDVDLKRVIKVIDWAIYKGIISNRKDLAEKLGYTESSLSQILNGKVNLSDRFINNLSNIDERVKSKLKQTDINTELEQPFAIDTEQEYRKAMEIGLRILPEVDFELAGGSAELINTSERTKRFWYLPDCTDCEGIATISGNSMAPAFPSGCQVALKRVGFDITFPLGIPFGQVFGVVVEDEITGDYHGHIKILRRIKDNKEMEHRYWIAESIDRENYDDFYIKISSVRGLWIVKQHIVQDVIL